MSKRVLLVYGERSELAPYEEAARAAGMEPVPVAAANALSLDGFDGLLLTGGGDVNPRRYGAEPHPETDLPDDSRDEREAALIGEALDRDLPLFAICRGMQMLNVHCGGALIQHLDGADRHSAGGPYSEPAHDVTVEPGTLLGAIAGAGTWRVNSRHHQAVDRLGGGLRICARDARDGVVEALDYPGKRFVLAVQWHPEDQAPEDAEQRKLFRAFAEAL